MSLDSPLVVTFNEAIKLFDFGVIDGRPVNVTFDDTYKTVTMQPNVGLKAGATYAGSILVPDMAGNLMTEKFTWSFATGL